MDQSEEIVNFNDTWVWSAHIDCESDNYQKSVIMQKDINKYSELLEYLGDFPPVHRAFGRLMSGTKSRMKSYSVFRKGINPAWEDNNNHSEFRFILPFKTASIFWSMIILNMLEDKLLKDFTNGSRILLDRRGKFRMEIWMSSMEVKTRVEIESALNKRLAEIKLYLVQKLTENNKNKDYDDVIDELNKTRSIIIKHIPKNRLYYVKQ